MSFTVSPGLTVNRDLTTGSNCIQERLAIASKTCNVRYYAGKQWDAFPVGDGDLVDSSLFSSCYTPSRYCPPGSASVTYATVVHELLRIRTVHAPFPNGGYRRRLLRATHVNGFLVRAPYRIDGHISRRGELTKTAAISPDDVGFVPCAALTLQKTGENCLAPKSP